MFIYLSYTTSLINLLYNNNWILNKYSTRSLLMHLSKETLLFLFLHFVTDLLMTQLQSLQIHLSVLSNSGILFHLYFDPLLNFFKGLNIILRHISDWFSHFTYSRSSTYSVNVVFGITKVIVDDKIYRRYIYSSSCNISAYQYFDLICFELI